jgi:hypothetical protein
LNKGVQLNEVDAIIQERLEQNIVLSAENCPRCTSNKYFSHVIEVDDVSKSNQIDSMVGEGRVLTQEVRNCIVCGLEHDKRSRWGWKQFFRCK